MLDPIIVFHDIIPASNNWEYLVTGDSLELMGLVSLPAIQSALLHQKILHTRRQKLWMSCSNTVCEMLRKELSRINCHVVCNILMYLAERQIILGHLHEIWSVRNTEPKNQNLCLVAF